MHYLFVGYYVDQSTFEKILERKINNMSVARQKFEYNLIKGLYEHLGNQIDFISYVPTDNHLQIPFYSYVNRACVKHIAIKKSSLASAIRAGRKFRAYICNLCRQHQDGIAVIMYAVNPIFEYYLIKYRNKFNLKLITICSEVPELRRYGNSLQAKIKKKMLTYFNNQFDGYIFFSAEMKNVVKCKNKPTMVLEGIAPEIRRKPCPNKRNIVMYAGGLAPDNNIPFLLECCMEVPEIEEVWICGVGSDENKIKELVAKDPRIKYFGRLGNDKVLKLEEQAKLLVNFRSPDVKLTKYSFPSKILEYIASGSLVLSTRLMGIPEEYFDYILGIDLENQSRVANELTRLMLVDDTEYIQLCTEAQRFISENKNYYVQSQRVVDFANRI